MDMHHQLGRADRGLSVGQRWSNLFCYRNNLAFLHEPLIDV